MLNMSTNKIVMIPTSLSAGFAVSLIPYITKTFAEGRLHEMHHQIRTSIGVLMFITVQLVLELWPWHNHYSQFSMVTIQLF